MHHHHLLTAPLCSEAAYIAAFSVICALVVVASTLAAWADDRKRS